MAQHSALKLVLLVLVLHQATALGAEAGARPSSTAGGSEQEVLVLFTDRTQLAHVDPLLEARVHAPVKGPVVVAPTEPWESYGVSAWTHVVQVSAAEARMYYDCVEGSVRGTGRRICLATSTDGGVTWDKPVLGIFSRNGSTANNIVLGESGNSVFLDQNPAAPASERWKMTCSDAAFASPDGLRWTRMGKNGTTPTTQMDDTKPTGNWDPTLQRYVIYVRRDVGGRHIGRCVTDDFTNWEKEAPSGCDVVFGADAQDPPKLDVYTNAWTPYPSIDHPGRVHLFFPSMFHQFPARLPWPVAGSDGLLDIRLVASRNGQNLSYTATRNARAPFVALGVNDCAGTTPSVAGGWCNPKSMEQAHTSVDTSAMYMASGYLPSRDGHEVFLYASGQPNTHGEWQPGTAAGHANSWGNNTGVRLLRLRADGFVSLDAPYIFSANLSGLPGFMTVPLRVPTGCAPPHRAPLPTPSVRHLWQTAARLSSPHSLFALG